MNIVRHTQYNLIEADQADPIRYSLGLYEEDTFKAYTPIMRCKDYTNDLVFVYNTPEYEKRADFNHYKIYAFKANELPYDKMREDGGIFMLLENLQPEWLVNLHDKIVPRMEELKQPVPVVVDAEEERVLLFIPDSLMKSTTQLSYLYTLFRYYNKEMPQDKSLLSSYDTIVNKHGLYQEDWPLPVAFGYANSSPEYTEKVLTEYNAGQLVEYVHACGVMGYWNAIKG